ncbi:hypothetical protein CCMA1212_008981, partial [Trichoderma ghanense]
ELVGLLHVTEDVCQETLRLGSISAIVTSSLDGWNPVCLDVDAGGCPGAVDAERGPLYSIDLD